MNQRSTSTFEWDTVFAIPVKNVNETIVQQKASPTQFNYIDSKEASSVKGNFSDWQIVLGGDGKDIHMHIPCSNIGGSIAGMDFACSSADLIIRVGLEFIPEDTVQNNDPNTSVVNLKIQHTSTDINKPVISLVSIESIATPTGKAVDTLKVEAVKDVIPALIIDWLSQNLQLFAHVFCTVELNKYIDKSAAWAWTKPSDIGYAYQDGTTADDSTLGILCMTGGRKKTVKQIAALDNAAIPEGAIAGFLISELRFLNDLILPTLPLQWPNTSVDDFEIVPSGNTTTGKYQWVLRLKEGKSFEISPVSYKDGSGNDVQNNASMTKLSIAIDSSSITMSARTETDLGAGVTGWTTSTHSYNLGLGTNSQHQQTIAYTAMGTPITDHGTIKTEWAKVIEWMAVAVGVIATIVLGVLTDGAAFVVGALIIGVLTGLAAISLDIVKDVNSDKSPSIDLLSFNTTNPIKWANSKVFKLTSAALNGPIQLGGNPNFS